MKFIKRIAIWLIVACIGIFIYTMFRTPTAYSVQTALANGDIVTIGGKQYNVDKLDRFVQNFNNGQSDSITITSYTTEGDAIIRRLDYDGKKVKSIYDARRDKFASHRALFKQTDKFDKIEVADRSTYIEYSLVKDGRNQMIFKR